MEEPPVVEQPIKIEGIEREKIAVADSPLSIVQDTITAPSSLASSVVDRIEMTNQEYADTISTIGRIATLVDNNEERFNDIAQKLHDMNARVTNMKQEMADLKGLVSKLVEQMALRDSL